MKIKKTIETTRTHTVLDKTICDLCDAETIMHCNDDALWGGPGRERSEVSVSLKREQAYSDCGARQTISFDLCPKCFRSKLLLWLAEQGATPTQTDEEW